MQFFSVRLHVALWRPQTQLACAIRLFTSSHSIHAQRNNVPVDTPSLYNQSQSQISDREIDSLLTLVQNQRFGAAERVLNNIIDARRLHRIVPHPAYESAALAALQWDDPKRVLRQFSIWFKLVPDINHPNAPPMSQTMADDSFSSMPYHRTITTLMQSGNPMSNFPIIKQFALICTSKGYVRYIYNWVVEPLPRPGTPVPTFLEFLDLIEAAAVKYEAPRHHTHNSCLVASQLRVAAVQLLCRLGWYRAATDVLARNAKDQYVILPDDIYNYFIRIGEDNWRKRRPRKRDLATVQRLRKSENSKRLNLEYLPRQQVRVQLRD